MSCDGTSITDITIVQGATFQYLVNVTGVDLTGASARMIVVGGYPKTEYYSWTSGAGDITITVTTPVTNQKVYVNIDESVTANEISNGTYNLFVTTAGGDVIRLVGGKYTYEKTQV